MSYGKSPKSQPDYAGWEEVRSTVFSLPISRFYFTITMFAFGLIAYLVRESVLAFVITTLVMLAYAITVFVLDRGEVREQKIENCSAESEDDARAAREIGEADGGNGCRKHDGHGSSSPSGLRTPLESQKEETADNHS